MSFSPLLVSFSRRLNHAEVVLPLVVVAHAEEPHAERLVEEQEAAEVRRDRLDADAYAVEVVARRDVAQVLVDEELLHPEEAVVAVPPDRGIDVDRAHFLA